MFGILKKIFGTSQDRQLKRYRKIVDKVSFFEQQYQSLTTQELQAKTAEFKERYKKGESLDALLPEAFAAVKNACRRLVGKEMHVAGCDQKWDMVPYDVQILGAIALHKGAVAEMQTGEGKTLTAILPLYLNALTAKPVHLVTVNDYLVKRDLEWGGVILRFLGLTTGALTHDTPMDQRQAIYQSDVVYGTASEFGFDYLRDNSMAKHKAQQVQRGYFFAIIDEVDSILIDEARTPLIISGPSPVSLQMYDILMQPVAQLVKMQRDMCNSVAIDARKILEDKNSDEKEKKAASHKLWLIGKGTPRNKTLTRLKEDPAVRAAIDKWDLYYHADQNKEARAEALADLYMVVDERGSEFELTEKGIHAWADCHKERNALLDFEMVDFGYALAEIDKEEALSEEQKIEKRLALQEEDAKRKERSHNIRQLLRANLLMERDIDYIVDRGQIVIIDENTGRAQPGRRFADGLHQAIEAKEGLEIQRETQTYATITLQNFFRMYEKIAGMTGTAITEAGELREIYKLDVLQIPTHNRCIRDDANDEIYMTEREKYLAILKDVRQQHAKGRPILVGTESVEVSEKLSRIFRQNHLEHVVLNAKQHEREAEIIANAGQKGAITIATNMAGRGTDIKLGAGVKEVGGLYVLGTTRHQSRRIDRQLRGRCARQGDPGASKFYVSFEDALLRLFASPRMTAMLQRFRPPEGEPISDPILDHSIETAQKRVEQKNSQMRKHTLEYDDVMNKHRQEFYSFRNEVLSSQNILLFAEELIAEVCNQKVYEYLEDREREKNKGIEELKRFFSSHFPVHIDESLYLSGNPEVIASAVAHRAVDGLREKVAFENSKVAALLPMAGKWRSPAESAIADLITRKLDHNWQEHLLSMDHLRTEVSMRAVGQRDPLMEFKHESFALFEKFIHTIREEATHDVFRFQIVPRDRGPSLEEMLKNMQMEKERALFQTAEELPLLEEENEELQKITPFVQDPKIGRNLNCPCGSGLKHKKCCGKS
jgi:preprotein translocase subunit SecA